MSSAVLTLNAGSSSLKFAVFETVEGELTPENLRVIARGQIEGLGVRPRLIARDGDGQVVNETFWPDGANMTHEDFLVRVLSFCDGCLGDRDLSVIGHRIVHGGDQFVVPAFLTQETLEALRALEVLAPLHQPHNLAAARAAAKVRADVPQIGVFDTAFHRTISPTARRLGLPRAFERKGIRRYGFHGLSYEWLTRRLQVIDPALASGRVIFAHLGSGASLCATISGRSVSTTMGFSTLDGLLMSTRCGALDPGVVLHLMLTEGLTVDDMSDLLYKHSGLLGVSGISGDMRTLLNSERSEAQEAIDLFTWRVAEDIAALTMPLRGLDGIVFSAGIGENAAQVRAEVIEHLSWMGIALEDVAASGERTISTPNSKIKVLVIPTDEERIIAAAALKLALKA